MKPDAETETDFEEIPPDAPEEQSTTFIAQSIQKIIRGGPEQAMLTTETVADLERDDQKQAESEAATTLPDDPDWQIIPPHGTGRTATATGRAATETAAVAAERTDAGAADAGAERTGMGIETAAAGQTTPSRKRFALLPDGEPPRAGRPKGPGSGEPPGHQMFVARKTTRWRAVYLAALRSCPNQRLACEAAAVSRPTVELLMANDREFANEVKAAMEDGIDLLHACMWQRATEGVLRPIYQGGIRVGYEVVYSDKLALELARAHRPQLFRADQNVNLRLSQGPPVSSPEQVLEKMKKLTPLLRNRQP